MGTKHRWTMVQRRTLNANVFSEHVPRSRHLGICCSLQDRAHWLGFFVEADKSWWQALQGQQMLHIISAISDLDRLRCILHIHWTDFVSNDVVRSRTGQTLLSDSPSTALVLLWSSVPCRHRSRPLPSSPGLHSRSSQRLATKNWKTEQTSENGWGRSAPAQLRPGDGRTARYG